MPDQTIDRVIAGGYCVGCGACAYKRPDDFAIALDQYGQFQARALRPAEARSDDVSALCPMSGEGPDETTVAAELYPDAATHGEIGRHLRQGVGWVEAGRYRDAGSSGGMLSWMAVQLLERGLVQQVVQVGPNQTTDDTGRHQLFSYHVSTTPDEVRNRAKSRYYPIHAVGALEHIETSAVPTLFIGLPCFVKMARALARADPAFSEHLAFTLGLICGHLKSAGFAELLAWQCDVPPEEIASVDFRHKVEGFPASSYGFTVSPRDGSARREKMMRDLLGRDWGQGMMKYKACDFCDDVVAECADVAVGDAWLPEWKEDWRGTNVFVVRHPVLAEILAAGETDGQLVLHDTEAETVAKSQASGLRHRREGLAHRLWRAERDRVWVPRKRVAPRKVRNAERRRIYDLRDQIRDTSHEAFQAARAARSLEIFRDRMSPLTAALDRAGRVTVMERVKRPLRRPLKALFRAFRRRVLRRA